jgi:hypothetical protein
MKLSNQNIYNLRGCKLYIWWRYAPPPPPHPPRKSVPGRLATRCEITCNLVSSNLVTFLLYHDFIRLVRTTLRQNHAIKIVTSCQQFQTCYNNWEQAVRTQLIDSL